MNISPNRLTSAHDVRAMCGGISRMTLHRWRERPELNFPKPVKVGQRNFWRAEEIENWLASR